MDFSLAPPTLCLKAWTMAPINVTLCRILTTQACFGDPQNSMLGTFWFLIISIRSHSSARNKGSLEKCLEDGSSAALFNSKLDCRAASVKTTTMQALVWIQTSA